MEGASQRIDDEASARDLGADRRGALRMIEALLFASSELLSLDEIRARLPRGINVRALVKELQGIYATRGVNVVEVEGRWGFRTAEDLAYLLHREQVEERKLSRAALETLAIIAYHQPVTRAEIEEIRGVSTSKGTLDVLLETGWIRMRGRRRTPGRPVTYGTTAEFLEHFMLTSVGDLPGLEELKGTGLLDSAIPAGFQVPSPDDSPDLREEEDPIDDEHMYELPLEGDGPLDDRDDETG